MPSGVPAPTAAPAGDGGLLDAVKSTFQLDVTRDELTALQACSANCAAVLKLMFDKKVTKVGDLSTASEDVRRLIDRACSWSSAGGSAPSTGPDPVATVPLDAVEAAVLTLSREVLRGVKKIEKGTELAWSVWWYGLSQLSLFVNQKITCLNGSVLVRCV